MPFDALSLDLPSWHRHRPYVLARALAVANNVAPHLAALAQHLLPHAPGRPLASQTIRAITRDRHSDPFDLDDAIMLPWLALDGQQARNVIAIDIDHADGPERLVALETYGLPRPTLILDPWSGRSHAVLRLATPVITAERARSGPKKLFELAGPLVAAALGGTLMPQRALPKNPWGRIENLIGTRLRRGPTPAVPAMWEAYEAANSSLMWITLPGDLRAIELREIVAALVDDYGEAVAVPKTRARFRKRRGEPDARGRNCTLFDLVRWWAYDTRETDTAAIEAEAARVNATFSMPLPISEVRATARSIGRFMRERYRPAITCGRRGRDAAEGADLTTAERQALAGKRSAAAPAAKMDAAIAAGVARLQAEGKPVTQTTLAAAAHLSRDTVKRRWPRLRGVGANAVLSGSAPTVGPSAHPVSDLARDVSLSSSASRAKRRRNDQPARPGQADADDPAEASRIMAELQTTLTAAIEAGNRPLLDALPGLVAELETARLVAAGGLPGGPGFAKARRTILQTLAEHGALPGSRGIGSVPASPRECGR